jgi:hypothetical protein
MPFRPVGIEQSLEREDELGAGGGDRVATAILRHASLVQPGHDTSPVALVSLTPVYAARSSIFSAENEAAGAEARKPEWVMNPTTITLTM